MHETHHLVAAHRGHWYTCPNGHIFSIGECGGAMQASRCNECGEAIGGGNHALLGTNRRANLMENIAADQGQGNPRGVGDKGLERNTNMYLVAICTLSNCRFIS